MIMAKKLFKTRDKKICGVCGGVANFFDVDPTIIRIAWVCSVLCFGVGFFAYFIAALIMPKESAE